MVDVAAMALAKPMMGLPDIACSGFFPKALIDQSPLE
jgi:hypothetical protein